MDDVLFFYSLCRDDFGCTLPPFVSSSSSQRKLFLNCSIQFLSFNDDVFSIQIKLIVYLPSNTCLMTAQSSVHLATMCLNRAFKKIPKKSHALFSWPFKVQRCSNSPGWPWKHGRQLTSMNFMQKPNKRHLHVLLPPPPQLLMLLRFANQRVSTTRMSMLKHSILHSVKIWHYLQFLSKVLL